MVPARIRFGARNRESALPSIAHEGAHVSHWQHSLCASRPPRIFNFGHLANEAHRLPVKRRFILRTTVSNGVEPNVRTGAGNLMPTCRAEPSDAALQPPSPAYVHLKAVILSVELLIACTIRPLGGVTPH